MSLDNFPWYLVAQAQERQRQNQQDMNQNIAGLGQGLGNSLATIGESIAAQKHKQMVQQLQQAMSTQGAPQQGPQMPETVSPMSGMGGLPQDNTRQIGSLMTALHPDVAAKSYFENMNNVPVSYTPGGLQVGGSVSGMPAGAPGGPGPGGPGSAPFRTRLSPKDIISIQEREAGRKESEDFRKSEREARQGFQSQIKTMMEGDKNAKEQDSLEKQYADRIQKIVQFRSGGLGLQDQKVNQAIDLRTMVNQYYDPATKTYNIPPALHSELVLGMAKLLNPSGNVGIDVMNELKQKTAREGLAKAAIYLGMNPKTTGGATQNVIKMFVDTIDRQGQMSEKLRDKYMGGLRSLFPTRLEKERRDRIMDTNISSSFNDLLKQSPDQGPAAPSGWAIERVQ